MSSPTPTTSPIAVDEVQRNTRGHVTERAPENAYTAAGYYVHDAGKGTNKDDDNESESSPSTTLGTTFSGIMSKTLQYPLTLAQNGLESVVEKIWKNVLTKTFPVARRLDASFDQGHRSVVSSLRWTSAAQDHGFVLSGCYDGTAKLWDDRTGEVKFTFRGGQESEKPRAVTSVELLTKKPSTAPTTEQKKCLAFTAQARELFVWSCCDGKLISRVEVAMEEGEVKEITSSPCGKFVSLALIGPVQSELAVYEVMTFSQETPRPQTTKVEMQEMSSGTGSVSTKESISTKFDVTLKQVARIQDPHGLGKKVWFSCWLPDSTSLFTGGADGSVALWNFDSTSSELKLQYRIDDAHGGDVWCGCLDSTGSILYTGGNDGLVKAFDVRSSEPVFELVGHTGAVRAITCTSSREKECLFTGSVDCSAKQWNTKTGKLVRSFQHTAGIRNIATKRTDNTEVPTERGSWIHRTEPTEFVCAGMDGALYVWSAAEDWMPDGEEAYHPRAVFGDIEKDQVAEKIMQIALVAVQIVGTVLLVSHGYESELEFPDHIEYVLHLLYADTRVASVVSSILTMIMMLAAFSFAFDLHGKTMGYIATLNRQGRGIKKHWDFGEVIDFETVQHKRAWFFQRFLANLHIWTSGALLMPITRNVFGGAALLSTQTMSGSWTSLFGTTQSPVNSTVLTTLASLIYTPTLYISFIIFLVATFSLAMVDNDVGQLPALSPRLYNPSKILFSRLTRFHVPRNFLGALTIDPTSGWLFGIVEASEKLLLTIFAIVSSAYVVAEDANGEDGVIDKMVPYFEVMIVSTTALISYVRPAYIVSAVSGVQLCVQLVLLWTLGVAVFSVSDDVEGVGAGLFRVWLAGVVVLLFLVRWSGTLFEKRERSKY